MEYYLRKKRVGNRRGYKRKKRTSVSSSSLLGRSAQRKVPTVAAPAGTAAVARAGGPTAAAGVGLEGRRRRAGRPPAAARQEGWRRHATRRAARAGRSAGACRKSGGGFVRGHQRSRPGLEGRQRRAWRPAAAWLGRPPAGARDGRQAAAAWRWETGDGLNRERETEF